ncbi:MAG: phosphate signaling complex protein PhoU [Planctomycetia bacterium]|nr:phosphate signaling complex protein PhoU [Planctomycetia bacterium]
MKIHFDQEIQNLNKLMIAQTTAVENAVRNSILSLSEGNPDLAWFVIVGDDALDTNEVRIEEECLKILALYQPVAGDLRYIITLLKVNAELERIGDLAVNIAERVMDLLTHKENTIFLDFSEMIREVSSALKKSLDSLLSRDADLAGDVIDNDSVIDDLHRDNMQQIKRMLQRKPHAAESILDFMSISRNLERIADGCTNIGEDVIYLEQGKIIRHFWKKPEEKKE